MISRLKSLELHGYKTFASRTLFEFPGNVTAIVGPNGSGKSNVADALRWVLGEQSYSLLRGRKTEDMIFSGSEQRPRAGMASASITFDNEDGWLPIDYSEVNIARRAYRDGQNEYLLNGQKVRLKETSELLAQSGLAERTYTIIGQGLVDAALALKPEERRKFFEEAAGIGLYRSRREEALNRLDTTRRNLERVLDILSELEPRLKSLEKQAARAIEYERIKADLRLLLREWYGYHWHRTQREMAHARDVLAAQEVLLDAARNRLEEVESKLKTHREQLQDVRNALNGWHTESAALHTQREKVSRMLAVMDERQRSLQDQEKNLKSDQGRLEEEHRALQDRLDGIYEERDRLQDEYQDAQAQVETARRNLEARQNERSNIEYNLREMRRQLVKSETRQVELKAHQGELENRAAMLRKNRESLQQSLQTADQSVEQASQKLEAAKAARTQAETDRKQFEDELQALQRAVAEAESQRKKVQDEQGRLNAEKSRIKAQLDVLEQAERSLTGLNQGSKYVLQAAQKGQVNGKIRAISSLIEVPAEYEQAIAAALGENLDSLFMDHSADLDHVLQLLEKGEKGRAVLYPVELLREANFVAKISDPDCLGVAFELIKAPEEVLPAVRLLLGSVMVVRDRKAARRLLPELPSHARLVTLLGEVFSATGAVVAGQEGRSSVIARPRQKRELQDALAEVEVRFTQATEQIRDLGQTVDHQRAAQQEKDKELRLANQKLNQLTQQFQQASLELEQVRQKRDWQKNQVVSLDDQIQKAVEEVKRTKAEIDKVSESNTGLNDKIRDLQRSLDRLPLEEFQSQVVHWNTNAAVTSRSLKDAERRLEENLQTIRNNKNQQQSIQTRLDQLKQSAESLEAEKSQLRSQEGELNQAIDVLQEQIEPAEKKLTQLEGLVEKIQIDQTAAQQGVSVAERHATQAQLELSRYRESLETLRRRIEEDFGLVAFEYTNEISGPTPLPLEGMVEALPLVQQIAPEIEENINRQRSQLRRMGAINPEAQSEYLSVKERHQFLTEQVADLKKADEDLREVIAELDALMRKEFKRTFDAVAAEFKQMFTRLFGGGSARLILEDEEHPTETGIDIEARLPGRREQGLSLLSGGERSLTAVALIFSLLKVSPTPFCVMDEVDAMLDEANVGRFCDLLRELSQTTQFIVITHNRNTVQVADVIYGITMGKDSASQMISLKLDEVSEEMVR